MTNMKNWLWTERYRPQTIDDCIIPRWLKTVFNNLIKSDSIPNLILSGPPGIGKTTIARILAKEIKAEMLEINASMYGNIDTLRTEILQFVTTQSIEYDRKCVILDEADYLNATSTQPALRHFIEEYHDVLFIMTCNYISKIIDPLQSRSTVIDFKFNASERSAMAVDFFGKIIEILRTDHPDITYDKTSVSTMIQKHFPDFRRIINELQKYVINNGVVDSGILASTETSLIQKLIELMKARNFIAIRPWCMTNSDIVSDGNFYGTMYNSLKDAIDTDSIPSLILLLADYQYKHAFVIDKELNATACIAAIISEVNFK